MKDILVSGYLINKFQYQYNHTAGCVISFPRPCIGYVLHGTAEFLYRGNTFFARSGDLIYIAAETKYYSVWSGLPKIEFYSIDFSFSSNYAFSDYRFQILKHFPRDLFDKMYAYFSTDPLASAAHFYLLLSDIYKKMKREAYFAKSASIEPAIQFIEEHYTENITVNQLSKLCGFSEPRFFVLFREATGVSPIAYKHNIIVQHALDYLSFTDLTIEEISDKLGFSSSNYFRKIFYKITKKTPKAVRRSLRRN